MKTKVEIKSLWGKIIFEFEKENNSVKDTLIEAVKTGAYLRGAYLTGAYLTGADLRGADLTGADLRGAYLTGADLRGAYLTGADLRGAYLRGADLTGAYLTGADLRGAYLRGADLRGAYLRGAYLTGADLKRIASYNSIIPEGEIIVWKKLINGLMAKLLIPIKAKRVNAIGSRKCRFEYAKVIAIYDGKKQVNESVGTYDKNLVYTKGKEVRPDSFDPSPLIECSNGIHAFITRIEAEEYNN
jgi:hypothetical protein